MSDATPVISATGLRYTYPGADQPAVRGIDFAVRRGEVFGFLGPSGAGKSTTQKVLIRLLRDYEGEASVFGRDLRSWGDDYFERVGISFELPSHYRKLTALENLRLFANLYAGERADPMALLERVGLDEDAHTRVGSFSKGMAMRLNFVRALLHRPDLLFLDEPTGGMDPVNARRIKALIQEQRAAGTTVFLTTHDMSVADELCDRVAFIVDGKIPVVDSPRALKLRSGQRRVAVEYRSEGKLERQEFALDGLGGDEAFATLLAAGHDIETLHTEEASLEQVFVDVTGRRLQ